MPGYWDTLCLKRIRVGNWEEHQCSLWDMSKMENHRLFYTQSSDHKAMAGKDWWDPLVVVVLLQNQRLKFYLFISRYYLLPMGWHMLKGSPVYRTGQLQIGLWLTTWHFAPAPQVPGHGSPHFRFEHASFWGHSELWTHSGRHVGGLPMYPWTQEHAACPLVSRHWLFGPHGDGLHGFCTTGATRINKLTIDWMIQVLSGSYSEWVCIERMHFLPVQLDSCTLVYDSRPHKLHFGSRFQGMD